MRRRVQLLIAAFAVFVALHPASAQKFLPKSIQFNGAPEYSNQELMAAAGLKKGVVLSYADMNDVSKRLMDTGVFSALAFKFDGQDLIFTITPSTDLYPIQIENLPITPGKELDAIIHGQLPLFHGKVPADGGLTEAVRGALETMLAGGGLQADVIKTTAADLSTQKVNAVTYSIASPPVNIGIARVDGVSDLFQVRVQKVLAEAVKNPFDTVDSASNLQRAIEQFYGDQGYAAAKVQVTHSGDPHLDSGTIVVPFAIHVEEGGLYTVKTIQLPPGTPMTQADIEKVLTSMTTLPMGARVRLVWTTVVSRYRSKGYLDCKVTPHASLNEADATVSYTVDIDPGPVYHLAFVKFEDVSDELRMHLIHNWEMMPGDPFDESYPAKFIADVQLHDPMLHQALKGVKTKFDVTANPGTHDVNLVIRLEKP
jgi:outer membrane protein assembly factor BamA